MKTLVLAVAAALVSISLYAQGQAQIQGTVLDSSGLAVPGADVKAIQTATSAVRTVTTGADGAYVLANLPIGPYRIEVSKQGFATIVQTGIVLQVATNPTVDISLKVGNVSEQVQVEANAALVETQATGVGQVIENKRILELPLNGRVATDLIQLAGGTIPEGVANTGSYQGTQLFAVNGGVVNGTGFWLDGSMYNNPFDSTNMPFPFPDALQEFKLETSVLTAQNGVHAGGTITAVTKSGTNGFHGDIFYFLRNADLNGTGFFSHAKDGLKRNQFGGTVGGPIKKDKIFFFYGYQDTITRQTPVATSLFIPTPAMIQGNFSACPADIPAGLKSLFTNNQINPALYDAATLKLAAKLPVSTDPCGKTFFGLVTQSNEGQHIFRVDDQTNEKNTLFARYILSHYGRIPSDKFSGGNPLETTQPGLDDQDQNWTVGDTYLFSPTLVNQFRASVSRIGVRVYNGDYFSACDLGVPIYCGFVPHQGAFTVTGGFVVGGGLTTPEAVHDTVYQLNNDVSWVRGAHQINMGMGGSMYRFLFLGTVYAGTTWTFPNLAQFLLGQFSANAISLPNPINQQKYFINGYAQDTWKVNRRLTVNAGVRWEPFLPPAQFNGAVYNFNMANMIAGVKTTVYKNAPPGLTYPGDPGFQGQAGQQKQWNLFAPRIAFGYDPTGTGKMTIRASFGIAYDYASGFLASNLADAPPFGGTEIWSGQFSNPYASNPGGNIFPYTVGPNAPFAPYGAYIVVQPNAKTTQVNQWNFVVQRQLGKDWVASATYTGSETEHLLTSYAANPATIVPCPGGAAITTCNSTANQNSRRLFTVNGYPGNALFGPVQILDNSGTSSYNGLLLSIQKRLSKGLAISANYTWSHCISDFSLANSTGNAGAGDVYQYNRRYDRSNCQSVELGGTFSADRRQNFNSTLVYETPTFSNSRVSMFASGWKLAGIYRALSAPWVTPVISSDVALQAQSAATQRPVQVLTAPLCANPNPACWINPAAFTLPPPGTYSSLARGNIQGPAFFQVDAAVSREFRVHEGQTLELRAEAFNISNSFRAGVAPPSTAVGGSGLNLTFGTSTFGQVLTALDPRIIQVALKFVF